MERSNMKECESTYPMERQLNDIHAHLVRIEEHIQHVRSSSPSSPSINTTTINNTPLLYNSNNNSNVNNDEINKLEKENVELRSQVCKGEYRISVLLNTLRERDTLISTLLQLQLNK